MARTQRRRVWASISQGLVVKIYPGIIVRRHRADRKQMGLLRELCTESRKGLLRYCCNLVWMKNGGRIPWNGTPICETFKISCLMAKHLVRGGLEYDFKGPVIPFGAMVEYHPILKTCRNCISSAREVLPGIFLGNALYARGIWKGNIMIADTEELEDMDASGIHARRLNAKEVLTPMSGEKFVFPIADGSAKLFGGDQVLRTFILNPGSPRPRRRARKSSGRTRQVFFNTTSRLITG